MTRIVSMACGVLAAGAISAFGALDPPSVSLERIGRYESEMFGQTAAEVVAFSDTTNSLYVINSGPSLLDIVSIEDPTNPVLLERVDLSHYKASDTSVAAYGDIAAVLGKAAEADERGGMIVVDVNDREELKTIELGYLPDMVTFSPDGRYILVANEGEPSDDYSVDPVGSISVIDISGGIDQAVVREAGFEAFNDQADQLRESGVRIFGPGASVAQDLEPEYVVVSPDSKTAWVALQENNALAVLDIEQARVTDILPLGFKDLSAEENALDTSDRDGKINLLPRPVFGMYQPDGMASYVAGDGQTYIVTANEGDSRDYDGFSEEARVSDIKLDPGAFPEAATLAEDGELGRLKITTTLGDTDGDGDFDELYAYGARSFSIWTTSGELVYDSGGDFERIISESHPEIFNSTNYEQGSFDSRSDDKGPEPEGVAVGTLDGRQYAFIGLERTGGVMTYDVTDPRNPVFQDYINERDDSVAIEEAGDLGPEVVLFVEPERSPDGEAMVIVSNEVSGTVAIYRPRLQ